jgi:hypothetical protein
MSYQTGDILFFAKGTGNPIGDTIVADFTASDIVHCAIAVSPLLKVEAVFAGVVISPIADAPIVWSYSLTSPNQVSLARALLWLHGTVGEGYGFTDLVNALLAHYETTAFIDTNTYDCSSLAAEFLQKVGGTPATDIEDVHTTTPASLAKLLGMSEGKSVS